MSPSEKKKFSELRRFVFIDSDITLKNLYYIDYLKNGYIVPFTDMN